jgi:hypothetical protein
VYEEIDDTLQVISIEAEWQMVSHYQLLYISLTLVYEEVGDTLQVTSPPHTLTLNLYIITDNDLPSVILPLY